MGESVSPQEDYDQGYEDGRRSLDWTITHLEERLAEARGDLMRSRDEVIRLRNIVFPGPPPHNNLDDIPF
jgi:hypothetical protein